MCSPGHRPARSISILLTLMFLVLAVQVANAQAPNIYSWSEVPPPTRSDHTAVYDPAGDRMILFGGFEGGTLHQEVWSLTLSGPPTWTLLKPMGEPPSPRRGHTAIYDPVRQRMLVFGGQTGALDNQVWSLSLSGPFEWSAVATSGTAPSPRQEHTAIYDPGLDRMLVFGGHDGALQQDVWQLSLSGVPTWTPLTPSGTPPSPRAGASAIYDPVRARMLVFGGEISGGWANDTWALELSGAAWSSVATTGPPSVRAHHGATYDPVRDRMLIVGGGPAVPSAVYALPLSGTSQWQTLSIFFSERAAGVYDPPRDRLAFHGGLDPGACYNTTVQVTLSPTVTFGPLSPSSWQAAGPTGLVDLSMVLDAANQRMMIYGGGYVPGFFEPQFNANALARDLTDTPGWVSSVQHPMGGRYGHTANAIPGTTPRMVVFGGSCIHLCSGPYNDVWQLGFDGGSTWLQLTPSGAKPAARLQHTTVYDPVRNSLIVFGGRTEDFMGPPTRFNDVWELNLSGAGSWTAWTPVGTPPAARAGHTAIYDENHSRMVVFGGRDAGGVLGDVWALSLTAIPTWTQLTPPSAPPAAREEHIALYDQANQRMLIQGGLSQTDAWALSLGANPDWSPLLLTGTGPYAHARQSAVLDAQGRIWIHGGTSQSTWKLTPAGVLDVPPAGNGAATRCLEGARPHPARGGVSIRLSLPDASPARLELIDLAGRTVTAKVVGGLGAGRHVVPLGADQRIPAGVYFARLVRGPHVEATKVVVLP